MNVELGGWFGAAKLSKVMDLSWGGGFKKPNGIMKSNWWRWDVESAG